MANSEEKKNVAVGATPGAPLPGPKTTEGGLAGDGRLGPALDFDDLKNSWERILDRRTTARETDFLTILPPRGRIDPLATAALEKVKEEPLGSKGTTPGAAKGSSAAIEKQTRQLINKLGLARYVKNVTDRLNRQHLSDAERLVLSGTYLALLYDFLTGSNKNELAEAIKDDLGVAEDLLLRLRAEDGPFHRFAGAIVDSVLEKNRIQVDKGGVLRRLAVDEVRRKL